MNRRLTSEIARRRSNAANGQLMGAELASEVVDPNRAEARGSEVAAVDVSVLSNPADDRRRPFVVVFFDGDVDERAAR